MRASRRTTNVMWASLLSGALLACGSRAHDDTFLATRVPVARLDSVLKAADSVRLSLADARTLLWTVAEVGRKSPHDTMSIGEVLAWARAHRAQKERVT